VNTSHQYFQLKIYSDWGANIFWGLYLCVTGDVSPEELVIDQVAAILQERHLRQQQREAAAMEAAIRYAPEIMGPGGEFSYHFPQIPGGRESQHGPYFAVNPSDPRYYLPKPPEPEEEEDGDNFLAERKLQRFRSNCNC
jgi:hypothetical protein